MSKTLDDFRTQILDLNPIFAENFYEILNQS